MNLRTIRAGTLPLVVLAGLVVACAGPGPQLSAASDVPLAVAGSQVSGIEASTDPRAMNIVTTVEMSASVPHVVDDPADLFGHEALVAIVKGTVTRADYRAHDENLNGEIASIPLTEVIVEIERATVDFGKTVTVRSLGGYAPASEDRHHHGSDSESDVAGDAVVEYTGVDGAAPLRVGDKVILFLWQPPTDGAAADFYFTLGDGYGRFVLDSGSGEYVRSAGVGDVRQSITAEQLDRVFE